MLGYIVPDKPELKVKEYELYTGYYCGICKSIARRFGQVPRMVLNYDAVFLALVLSALETEEERLERERCIVHPVKNRIIVYDQAGIDYAADIMLLLAWFKLKDDKRDENSLKSSASLVLLKNTFKKLMKIYGEKGIIMESRLKELSLLEEERCPSLDRAAEPFALFMKEVFVPKGMANDPERADALGRIGYHTGKWIYLIDAYDDLEENAKTGNYNPLICQFGYQSVSTTERDKALDEFRNRIRERVEYNLHYYLAELAKAWQDLAVSKNKGLIENIIYFGLLKKTEQVLQKGNRS